MIPDFPCKCDIQRCFEKARPVSIVWLSGASTYPLTMELLSIPQIQSVVMHGLISSLGSLTESTVRESAAAFRKYSRELSADLSSLKLLASNLAATLKVAIKEERYVLISALFWVID